MQHVTAFERPQTVPVAPATVGKRNLWILSSWRDLILYVATPLLLIPAFALAQAKWSAQDIYVFVAAFGAMGHHLPGMIRAYGDKALFERFRWRFIFAPIFLALVCVSFYWWDLKGIILIVFFWGVWHGMMQTYGFCRIYDAKTGSFAALSRRLDFALCATWFAAAVLLSPSRMADTLETYYASGGPFIPPPLLFAVQKGILFAAIAVAILFLGNFAWMWSQGKRSNPVKLALLVTSIAFWWYCNIGIINILAGIALFEVFHDVQYLSLVWIYNRNRVEKDSSIAGFMRFVFRRSGSLVGLYIGLVFAYGSLAYFNSQLQIDSIKRILTGVVAASGLLHFYYDGFIWKVRERSTRESLGLTGGGAVAGPGWILHGLKWVGVFILPLAALWIGQTHSHIPETERASWAVQNLPTSARSLLKYGEALQQKGRAEEAAEQFRLALKLTPGDASAHISLGGALMAQSKVDDAVGQYEEALRLDPRGGDYQGDYALALERLGRYDEATAQFEAALRARPRSALLHRAYGGFLARRNRMDQAAEQYRLALRVAPNEFEVHRKLADILLGRQQLDEAKTEYLETLRLSPKDAHARNGLGNVYFSQGQLSQAIVQYQEALRLDPSLENAQENLRLAEGSDPRFRPPNP